jgi:hypothetical protein
MLFIGGRGWGKEVIKNASSLKPSPPAKNAGGEGASSYKFCTFTTRSPIRNFSLSFDLSKGIAAVIVLK